MAAEQMPTSQRVSIDDAGLRRAQDEAIAAAETATAQTSRMTVIKGIKERRRQEVREERIAAAAAAASLAVLEGADVKELRDRVDSFLLDDDGATETTMQVEHHYTLHGETKVVIFEIAAEPRASSPPRRVVSAPQPQTSPRAEGHENRRDSFAGAGDMRWQ